MGINPTPTQVERRLLFPKLLLLDFFFSPRRKGRKGSARKLLFFSLRILCGLYGFARDFYEEFVLAKAQRTQRRAQQYTRVRPTTAGCG